ncbi:MAG: hypothetical protein ACX933_05545 [Marinobacter adhaerens]
MTRETGTFNNYGNGLKYVALSRAPKVAGIPAHELTDAISKGRLAVVEVSGCKCVTLADLVALVRGAKA